MCTDPSGGVLRCTVASTTTRSSSPNCSYSHSAETVFGFVSLIEVLLCSRYLLPVEQPYGLGGFVPAQRGRSHRNRRQFCSVPLTARLLPRVSDAIHAARIVTHAVPTRMRLSGRLDPSDATSRLA